MRFNEKIVSFRITPAKDGEICIQYMYDGEIVHEVIRFVWDSWSIFNELRRLRKIYEK